MIEIFKTNISKQSQARMLINLIQQTFVGYSATFDLEDCDRVLRVKSVDCEICAKSIILVFKNFGFHAEILEEDLHTFHPLATTSLSASYN